MKTKKEPITTAKLKIAELEDIICTMKFEINGLKSVIVMMEEANKIDREKLVKQVEKTMKEVIDDAQATRDRLEDKNTEADALSEKVFIYNLRLCLYLRFFFLCVSKFQRMCFPMKGEKFIKEVNEEAEVMKELLESKVMVVESLYAKVITIFGFPSPKTFIVSFVPYFLVCVDGDENQVCDLRCGASTTGAPAAS